MNVIPFPSAKRRLQVTVERIAKSAELILRKTWMHECPSLDWCVVGLPVWQKCERCGKTPPDAA